MPNIVLYSTHCPKCSIVERKLNEKNIVYDEVNDIDNMIALGLTEVPWLKVDGRMMNFGEAIKWINQYNGVV